jgi:peptidoglycan/xylan/chitin deacetylase (PgdA/CDA1 family)
MRNKKHRLAAALTELGLVRAASLLPRRPRLTVFNYHRIGSIADNPYDDGVYSATAKAFREQVLFLRRHFDLPPLERVVAAAADGFEFRRPTALITFDDGYRDNYELAYPVLRDCGVPAVFFIPTGYVDHPRIPWWDRIAYAIKHSTAETLVLDIPARTTWDLRSLPRPRVVKAVLDVFKQNAGRGEDEFIAHLEERAGIALPDGMAARRWNMTWDEIREVASGGISIGSHTHTHGILAGMDEAAQLRELQTSKSVLEREIGRPVTTVAYPVGIRAAFNDTTKRAARRAGYRLGFSYYGGVNDQLGFDPFDVRRVTVELEEPMSLFRTRAVFNSVFGRCF